MIKTTVQTQKQTIPSINLIFEPDRPFTSINCELTCFRLIHSVRNAIRRFLIRLLGSSVPPIQIHFPLRPFNFTTQYSILSTEIADKSDLPTDHWFTNHLCEKVPNMHSRPNGFPRSPHISRPICRPSSGTTSPGPSHISLSGTVSSLPFHLAFSSGSIDSSRSSHSSVPPPRVSALSIDLTCKPIQSVLIGGHINRPLLGGLAVM
jgi:hypothetical protein